MTKGYSLSSTTLSPIVHNTIPFILASFADRVEKSDHSWFALIEQQHPKAKLVDISPVLLPNRPSSMLLLVIVAIKHNFIQLKIKRDDLPPPSAEIRPELDVPLCPELLLLLLGRRVVPVVRGGADSVQTAGYVLLEGLDVVVGESVER